MTRFWIGTSGYNHKQWRGGFYPQEMAEEEMLRFYAAHCDSLEITQTFQRFVSVRQMQGWARDVGDDFTFSLKAPRRITHDLQLRDAGEIAVDFCENATALGAKLGPLLFQLPPFLKRDVSRLEDFLHQLPPEKRVVFEFRNASWFNDEVFECLRRFGSALCVTDRDDLTVPPEPTAAFGYFRMRRAAYDDAALSAAAERIRMVESSWDEVFIYFKHESDAPAYAAALRQRLVASH